jgi:hypothetical protein
VVGAAGRSPLLKVRQQDLSGKHLGSFEAARFQLRKYSLKPVTIRFAKPSLKLST